MLIVQKNVPLVATSVLFTSIAFSTVVLRLYTRFHVIKNAGVEDYLVTVAMCASIGFMIVVMYQIKYGLGQPFESMPPEHIHSFLQCLWATIPVYNVALIFSKLSIVFQYKRVFTTTPVQKFLKVLIAILIVYGSWCFFGSTFMCVPVQFFWGIGTGHCMNRLAFWFSNAAVNIATDIVIFAIPVPLIRQLQLPKKQKLALMVVFVFGAFVCVTSIIRLRSLYLISISTDTSLDGVDCAIWSGIEINVAISCASLPTLRPLLSRLLPGILSSNHSKGPSNLDYGNTSRSHQLHSIKGKNEIHVERTVEIKGDLSDDASERNLVDPWSSHDTDSPKAHDMV